jgi:hypothetical protein
VRFFFLNSCLFWFTYPFYSFGAVDLAVLQKISAAFSSPASPAGPMRADSASMLNQVLTSFEPRPLDDHRWYLAAFVARRIQVSNFLFAYFFILTGFYRHIPTSTKSTRPDWAVVTRVWVPAPLRAEEEARS